jgi:hypothetical protein
MGRIAMRSALGLIALVLSTSAGCATSQTVRYVYQDGDFGVVGMPENTDRWPTHYRRHAEKLMDAHFPEGHEIVRAEEVEAGLRTLKLEGSSTAEIAPTLLASAVSALKLGHSASRSQADTVKIKECRIIYRRAGASGPPPDFSEIASLEPTEYLDPNALARRRLNGPPTDEAVKLAAEELENHADTPSSTDQDHPSP